MQTMNHTWNLPSTGCVVGVNQYRIVSAVALEAPRAAASIHHPVTMENNAFQTNRIQMVNARAPSIEPELLLVARTHNAWNNNFQIRIPEKKCNGTTTKYNRNPTARFSPIQRCDAMRCIPCAVRARARAHSHTQSIVMKVKIIYEKSNVLKKENFFRMEK